jgi:Secretion system C-terminal sorting domain
MKKFLPVLLFSGLCAGMSAQTLLFSDNFDSYTAGQGVAAQSSDWDTWDGSTGVDGMVSADYANSGANSAVIDGTGTDLVLPIGPYVSGKYDVKWNMYLPTGTSGAYFNAMHVWSSSSTTYEWGLDVFFDDAGEVTWTTGAEAGGAANVNIGEWFEVQVTVDLDNDEGVIYIGGTIVHTFQWSLDNADGTAGTNQLSAIDYFGTDAGGGEGLYYIDDVEVWESTGVGVAQPVAASFGMYPNPADEVVTLQQLTGFEGGVARIYDLTGKLMMQVNLGASVNREINVAQLSRGVYMVKVSNDVNEFTKKLVIR